MYLGIGQLPEHMETIFQAFPLAELPPPPTEVVFRTAVAGPRPCAWYEDEREDRTCRFPGMNFLLAVAGMVLVVVVGRRR